MRPLCEINGVAKNYPEGLNTLEEMLLFMMDKEISSGDLISEVKVDGETYSEAYENQAREVDLKNLERIEITTQTQEDFARDTIREADLCLSALERGFGTSAGLLKNPEGREKGYEILAQSLDALHAFKSHMDEVAAFIRPDDGGNGEKGFWKPFEELSNRMIAFQEGQESLKIAALVEEALIPFLETWKKKIEQEV